MVFYKMKEENIGIKSSFLHSSGELIVAMGLVLAALGSTRIKLHMGRCGYLQ
jgi:hypothetical protein